MLLEKPWLEDINPVINWRENIWCYPRHNPRLKILSPASFLHQVKKRKDQIFVLKVSEVEDQPTIPGCLEGYEDVFSEERARELASTDLVIHVIEIIDDKKPPYLSIYNLSARELEVLREYIDDNLSKRYIREFTSPAEAPVLFALKQDGGLRLCVNFRDLNKMTIKNCYFLSLIDEMLNRLSGARVFIKMNLRDVYHRIRIREEDE